MVPFKNKGDDLFTMCVPYSRGRWWLELVILAKEEKTRSVSMGQAQVTYHSCLGIQLGRLSSLSCGKGFSIIHKVYVPFLLLCHHHLVHKIHRDWYIVK